MAAQFGQRHQQRSSPCVSTIAAPRIARIVTRAQQKLRRKTVLFSRRHSPSQQLEHKKMSFDIPSYIDQQALVLFNDQRHVTERRAMASLVLREYDMLRGDRTVGELLRHGAAIKGKTLPAGSTVP